MQQYSSHSAVLTEAHLLEKSFNLFCLQGRLPEQGDVLHRRHLLGRRHSSRYPHLQELHHGTPQRKDTDSVHPSSQILVICQPGIPNESLGR